MMADSMAEMSEVVEDPSLKCLSTALEEFHEKLKVDSNFLNSFCPATWDSMYCWPFTPPGTTLTRSCAEVMKDSPDITSTQLATVTGNAIRICGNNGTWLWGNWTNYGECLDSLGDDEDAFDSQSSWIVETVRWTLFLGSVLSFLSLAISLFIFYHFKCLRCHRVTVHIHFMISLALRFVLLVVVTEPFIFQRTDNYRKVNWICKCLTCALMYVTVTSINWMFIQGHYLHSRVTTNIFDTGTPFRIYYIIGWGIPLLLISIWAVVMETHHHAHCWQNYSQLKYSWILVGPMIGALTVNLLFLSNIMRILLTKIQRANASSDAAQFRRAVKATAILFPLLGINNLMFMYNPGGGYENVYMLANTIIQSTQGIFVSCLYCFFSSDVREALRREYHRFSSRRFANSFHQNSTASRATSVIFRAPKTSQIRNGGEENARNLSPSPETCSYYHEIQSSPRPSLMKKGFD